MSSKFTTPFIRSFVSRKLTRMSAYDVFPMQHRKLQTSKSLPASIYEFRSYQAPPKDFKALIELFNEHIHKRTRHSKLVGFWTVEIGDVLWQVVHLWEYASLQERVGVRKALAQDEAWAAEFLSYSMPKMKVMMNQLIVPAPSTDLDLNFTNNTEAVYVLETVKDAHKEAAVPKSTTEDERLVGRFTTLLGPKNTELRLWRYLNIDSVTQECLNRAKESPSEGSSVLLYPTAFSPIK